MEARMWRGQCLVVRDWVAALGLLVVPAFTFRILVVASFDLSVATAIVANSSSAQLVSASLLTVLPSLFLWGPSVGAYYLTTWSLAKGRSLWLVLLGLFALSVLTLPAVLIGPANPIWAFLPLLAVFGSASFAVNSSVKEGRALVAIVTAAAAALIVALVVFPRSMWLPPERLDVAGRSTTAYVLTTSGDDLVVFDPTKRSVLRVPLKKVADRQFCRQPDIRTVAHFLFGSPTGLPECP